jgi:hypothetical protein
VESSTRGFEMNIMAGQTRGNGVGRDVAGRSLAYYAPFPTSKGTKTFPGSFLRVPTNSRYRNLRLLNGNRPSSLLTGPSQELFQILVAAMHRQHMHFLLRRGYCFRRCKPDHHQTQLLVLAQLPKDSAICK